MNGYFFTLGVLTLICLGVVLGLVVWSVRLWVISREERRQREERQDGIKRAAQAEMARDRGPKVVEGKVMRELSPLYQGEMPGARRVASKDLQLERTQVRYDPLHPLNPISPINPFNASAAEHGPSDCAPKYDGGVDYSSSPSSGCDSGGSSPSSSD